MTVRIDRTLRRAVLGDEELAVGVLLACEPAHLPWIIAREVGLKPYPEPELREPVTLTLEQIASIQRVIDAGEQENVPSPLSGEHAAAVVALLRDRNAAWRITVTTTNEDGEAATRSVAALDGGPHGLYLTEAVDTSDGAQAVRLHPARAQAGVESLLALFDVAIPEEAPA